LTPLFPPALGPTRVPGNAQPACFNRQNRHVSRAACWRLEHTAIGRFYNGRDYSTLYDGIQGIELMRETDSDMDVLFTELKQHLFREHDSPDVGGCQNQVVGLAIPDQMSMD
jgi:hypothetical protein